MDVNPFLTSMADTSPCDLKVTPTPLRILHERSLCGKLLHWPSFAAQLCRTGTDQPWDKT